MKHDDVKLIQRVLAGDDTAFSVLVRKYQKPVHALAWRKIGDFHIAEEITQDTFLKAYQKLTMLKEPQRFLSWLYVIATNLCKAWLRKKRLRTESLENTSSAALEKATYSGYVISENERTAIETQREVVKKLLAKLQESERTIVTLRYFGEMSSAEIGEFLGISANTVRSRLRRAQQRLKKEEPMIREALEHFQITPNLTENIMREVSRLKPGAPSGGKPFVPWAIGVSTLAVVLLMLGIGTQHLLRFQKPYSFDATSEMTVEIIEAPAVLNLEAKSDIQTQLGGAAASDENDVSEKQSNDAPVYQNSQTWNLPENAIARFGKGVMGGSDRAVAFSPDGKHLAIATGAGIWIYDPQTYREMALLTGHTGVIRTVAFSPDGETLASGARDATVKLWNVENGENITTLARNGSGVESVAFSPDGKMLAAGAEGGIIKLWDIENGQNLATFKGDAPRVFSVVFSPDSKTVASGGSDNTIKLWDVETKQNIATLIGHEQIIFSVAFSPDGRILASGSQDDTVRLWHVETGQDLHTFKHRERVFSVAFSPDGKVIAGGTYRGIKLWNIETGEEVRLKGGTTVRSGSIAFSPDGTTFASASVDRFGGTSGAVTLWDIETGKGLATLHGHTERISAVAFSPDGKTLASGLRDGTVKLWNVKTGENIYTYRGGGYAVAFSPDGKTLAAQSWNNIKLWEVATRKSTSTIAGRGRVLNRQALVFSPDSQVLAWGTGDQVKLRKHATKSLFGFMDRNTITLKRHADEVCSVAFSPDGKVLASSVRVGTVKLWDTETSANIETLRGAGGPVVFSPDRKMLASCGNVQEIKLWNLETGEAITTLRGNAGAVFDLTFSPDGTTLVSGNGFGTIKFWDVATGENIATLKGHTGIVFSVDFSSDGTILASGSQDGTVLLWDSKRVVELSSQHKKAQEQE